MSQVQQIVRIRTQRTASTAVDRARLALVPVRPSSAPRLPFAVLVFGILAAGVVGLLVFNTHMQQASFHATALEQKADRLEARNQALELRLSQLRDPQSLAVAGRKLGLVAPPTPAFLDLATGRVLGRAQAATVDDAVKVVPPRSVLPWWGKPPAVVIRVHAPVAPPVVPPVVPPAADGQTPTTTGPASTASGARTGTNDGTTSSQGAAR